MHNDTLAMLLIAATTIGLPTSWGSLQAWRRW